MIPAHAGAARNTKSAASSLELAHFISSTCWNKHFPKTGNQGALGRFGVLTKRSGLLTEIPANQRGERGLRDFERFGGCYRGKHPPPGEIRE